MFHEWSELGTLKLNLVLGLSLTSEFRCHVSVPHLEAFYHVNKFKLLCSFCFSFFLCFSVFCGKFKLVISWILQKGFGVDEQYWSVAAVGDRVRMPNQLWFALPMIYKDGKISQRDLEFFCLKEIVVLLLR